MRSRRFVRWLGLPAIFISGVVTTGCATLTVAISPNGKYLAYTSDADSPLYVKEIGSQATPKSYEVSGAYALVWSPDGTRVAWSNQPGELSMLGTADEGQISVLDVTTGKVRKLSSKLLPPLAWADDQTLVGCRSVTPGQPSELFAPRQLIWLNLSTGKVDGDVPLRTSINHLTSIGNGSFLADSQKQIDIVGRGGIKNIALDSASYLQFADALGGAYILRAGNMPESPSTLYHVENDSGQLQSVALPQLFTSPTKSDTSYDQIISVSPSGTYLVAQHWDDQSPKPVLKELMQLAKNGADEPEEKIENKAKAKQLYKLLTSPTNKFQVEYSIIERDSGKTTTIATRMDKQLPFALTQASWSPDEKSLALTSELSEISETWLIDPTNGAKQTLVNATRPGPFAILIPMLASVDMISQETPSKKKLKKVQPVRPIKRKSGSKA